MNYEEMKKLFKEILLQFKDDNKWTNAYFKEIKIISNTKVGDIGQKFIEKLCDKINLKYELPTDKNGHIKRQSPWDIKIAGIKFELKTATEDTHNKFQFNHIRYHREYEAVLCLGVSPDELYFNLYTKSEIVTGKAGKLVSMEKGANASYKLTKSKKDLYTIDLFEKKFKEFKEKYEKLNSISQPF